MTTDLDRALIALRVSRDHGHGAVLNDAEVRALLAEIDRLTRERDEARAGRASMLQAITDPENQPSQYGTVTLVMYETVAAEREVMAKDAARLATLARPEPFCEYAGVDLHEQASIYASAFGREEPNRNDYVAALRDAVDAQIEKERSEQKEGA